MKSVELSNILDLLPFKRCRLPPLAAWYSWDEKETHQASIIPVTLFMFSKHKMFFSRLTIRIRIFQSRQKASRISQKEVQKIKVRLAFCQKWVVYIIACGKDFSSSCRLTKPRTSEDRKFRHVSYGCPRAELFRIFRFQEILLAKHLSMSSNLAIRKRRRPALSCEQCRRRKIK